MLGLAFLLLLEFCNYYEKTQANLLEEGRPCEEKPYFVPADLPAEWRLMIPANVSGAHPKVRTFRFLS